MGDRIHSEFDPLLKVRRERMHQHALLKPPDRENFPLAHLFLQESPGAQDTRSGSSFSQRAHVKRFSRSISLTVKALVCIAFIRAARIAAEISVRVREMPVV